MIKNRNIADDAGIMAHKVLGFGRAKVLYVGGSSWKNKGESTQVETPSGFKSWISGKAKLGDNLFLTVQEAVIASTGSRGDVIVVGPVKIQENVWVVNRPAIKILGTSHSWEHQWRASDGSTAGPHKYGYVGNYGTGGYLETGGTGLIIMSRSVEVSGFLFDSDGGCAGIYVGDGDALAANATSGANFIVHVNAGVGLDDGDSMSTDQNAGGAWIHHNTFVNGYYGIGLEGASANTLIENNVFDKPDYSVFVGGYSSRSNQRQIIRDNEFHADASGYGVFVTSMTGGNVGTLIARNTFRDGSSLAFTYAVSTAGSGVSSIVGNIFACANPVSAQSTDFFSGNFLASAGNAPHYVQDSTNSV